MNAKLHQAIKIIFNYLPEYRRMNIFGFTIDVEGLIMSRIDERMSPLDQAKLLKEIKDL